MLQLDAIQIIGVATALSGVIVFLGRTVISTYDRWLKDMAADRDHWRSIAEQLSGQTGRAIEVNAKDKGL